MADDNLQNKIHQALQKEREGLDAGFEKYRGSGLAVAATLITLSSGIFYLGFSEWEAIQPLIGYVTCIFL